MLSKNQINKIKKTLTQRLDEINSNIRNADFKVLDISHRSADQCDRASLESAGQLNIRIKERESRLILKIELALEKIENGTFGICEDCGEDISVKRLIARPVTTLCIQCKQNEEAKEKVKTIQCWRYA